MATSAQIDANCRNAQSSTGPRTDAGKATASQNAYKHGLRSASPVARGEDPAAWLAFAADVIAEYDPVAPVLGAPERQPCVAGLPGSVQCEHLLDRGAAQAVLEHRLPRFTVCR